MSPTQSSAGRAPGPRKPNTGSGSSQPKGAVLIVVAIIGLIGTVTAAGITSGFFKDLLGPRAMPTPLPATVKILSLQDGQRVASQVAGVEGTYARVAEDERIWLIVAVGERCYPQAGPAEKLAAGLWRHGPVQFPQPGELRLWAVLASPAATEQLALAVGLKGVGISCNQPGVELKYSITLNVSPDQAPTATTAAPTSGATPRQESSPTLPAAGAPRIEFIYPVNETVVNQAKVGDIRGRFTGFASGDELWLVVFVGSSAFVQNGPAWFIQADGTWFHNEIYFGTEQNFKGPERFRLIPVVVRTDEARGWFRAHASGDAVQDLAKGAEMLPGIIVTRVNASTPAP